MRAASSGFLGLTEVYGAATSATARVTHRQTFVRAQLLAAPATLMIGCLGQGVPRGSSVSTVEDFIAPAASAVVTVAPAGARHEHLVAKRAAHLDR